MRFLRCLLAGSLGLSPLVAADSNPAISAAHLLARTKILASDEFEGRGPGTAGEEKTVANSDSWPEWQAPFPFADA